MSAMAMLRQLCGAALSVELVELLVGHRSDRSIRVLVEAVQSDILPKQPGLHESRD